MTGKPLPSSPIFIISSEGDEVISIYDSDEEKIKWTEAKIKTEKDED